MKKTPKPEMDGQAGAEGTGSTNGGPDSRQSQAGAPAPRETSSRYIFFSSQRTGSTYLCRRLYNVRDRFGMPMEYLNPKIFQGVSPELAADAAPGAPPLDLAEHLRRVERCRTTADGRFGIKIQPQQLLPLLERSNGNVAGFLRHYEHIVVLTRRDKLGQAVSGALAQASGKWFDDGADPRLEDKLLAGLCPDVASRLSRYISEETHILRAAGRSGRPVLHLDYEEIQSEPDATFNRVLVFLGEPRGIAGVDEADLVRVPRKPAGELARRLRALFLDFIAGTGPYSVPRAQRASGKAE